MVVTSVKFDRYEPKDSGVCAECSIVLDDSLCIHKVLIIVGKKGEFVAFPNTGNAKMRDNCKRYLDIVHPIKKELKDNITSQVLEAYHSYN